MAIGTTVSPTVHEIVGINGHIFAGGEQAEPLTDDGSQRAGDDALIPCQQRWICLSRCVSCGSLLGIAKSCLKLTAYDIGSMERHHRFATVRNLRALRY